MVYMHNKSLNGYDCHGLPSVSQIVVDYIVSNKQKLKQKQTR